MIQDNNYFWKPFQFNSPPCWWKPICLNILFHMTRGQSSWRGGSALTISCAWLKQANRGLHCLHCPQSHLWFPPTQWGHRCPGQDTDSPRNWQGTIHRDLSPQGTKCLGSLQELLLCSFYPQSAGQLWSWHPTLPWTAGTKAIHRSLQRAPVGFPSGHRPPEPGNSCLTQS